MKLYGNFFANKYHLAMQRANVLETEYNNINHNQYCYPFLKVT